MFTSTTTSTAWWVKFLLSSFHYWRRAAKFGPLLDTYILWVPCDTEPRFVQSHLNDCHIQSHSMASQGYWGPVLTPQEPSKRNTTECNQNHCKIKGCQTMLYLNNWCGYGSWHGQFKCKPTSKIGKFSRIILWAFDLRLGRGVSPNFQPRRSSRALIRGFLNEQSAYSVTCLPIGGILLPCTYKMNYVNLQRRYVNMRRNYVKKLVDIIMLHEWEKERLLYDISIASFDKFENISEGR